MELFEILRVIDSHSFSFKAICSNLRQLISKHLVLTATQNYEIFETN